MLDTDHAESRKQYHLAQLTPINESLAKLYELYLSHSNVESKQTRKAVIGFLRTVAVYVGVFVGSFVWTRDLVMVLVAGAVAMAINRALDLLEVWWSTIKVKGVLSVFEAPRIVEMLFSSQSRYPYWWYSSYVVPLLLCLFPFIILVLVSLSPIETTIFGVSWFAMLFSMYLTPATPPFVVVSAPSSLVCIDLVAKLAFRTFPLRVVSLLDYELLRSDSAKQFGLVRTRYDAAKAHYLFRARENWQKVFLELAECTTILIVDARRKPSPPVDFEVSHIVQNEHLIKKTLFMGNAQGMVPMFQELTDPPSEAMLIADADIEVLVWALARHPQAVSNSDGFLWHSRLSPQY